MIKLLRKSGEDNIIQNIDDYVSIRYAYGNQNGYVANKGTELQPTVSGDKVIIGSGRIVLDGVEVDIDANGYEINIETALMTRLYYLVYLQINLGTETARIITEYSASGYPTVTKGDDLTAVTNGVANLPLFRFVADGGVVQSFNIERLVSRIEYSNDTINNKFDAYKEEINNKFAGDDKTQFGDYVISKAKILYANEAGITNEGLASSDTLNIQLSENVNDGEIIRIKYKANVPSTFGSTGVKYGYIFMSTGSSSSLAKLDEFNIVNWLSNAYSLNFASCTASISRNNPNVLLMTATNAVGIDRKNLSDSAKFANTATQCYFTIYEVAKVIE